MARVRARFGIDRRSAQSAYASRAFNRRGPLRTPARPRRKKLGVFKSNMGIVSSGLSSYQSKSPFPPSWRCQMTYDEVRDMTAGSVGTYGTEIIYSCNGPYDPRYSTGGSSCYGWSNISALYSNYRVNAVKVELTWTNPSGDGLCGGYLIQAPNDADTLTSDTVELASKKPNSGNVFLNDTGSQTSKQVLYLPMHKLMGVSKLQYKANLDQYTSGSGTVPTLQSLLRIALSNLSTGASGGTCSCQVKLTYYMLFYNRAII